MKKVLVVVTAIAAAMALVAWVILWFWAEEAVATSAARPWPGGMGRSTPPPIGCHGCRRTTRL
ncbi:MAG TPA: hypothetical protein VGK04_07915 [Thermoanaerobaculia bacterium]